MLIAMRLLAATPKSRRDLKSKLADKGLPEDLIEEVLLDLERQGLLCDKVYAQNLAAKYTNSNPSGRRKISFELKRKGIDAPLREEILENLSPEAERERAKELAQGRWHRFSKLEPEKRRKRIYDFLIRRGFEFDLIRDVMTEIQNENRPDTF